MAEILRANTTARLRDPAAANTQQPSQSHGWPVPSDPDKSRTWMYNQGTGQLRDPEGRLVTTGYSGLGDNKNKPGSEHLPFKGPIPRGLYAVTKETRTRGILTLVLEPSGHDAKGRSDFRIHGDSRKMPGSASEGCIILDRQTRKAIRDHPVKQLLVVDEPEWK